MLDVTKYFGHSSGGIRTYLLEKARYVAARPELRQVIVVPGPRDQVSTAAGARLYRLRGPRIPANDPYRFLLATRTLRRIVEHEHPGLIEVGSPLLVPWLARLSNRRLRAPMIWHYHSHLPRLVAPVPGRAGWARRALARGLSRYVGLLARRFALVIVGSAFAEGALAGLGVRHLARLPLGVDLDTFRPERARRRAVTRRELGLPEGPLAIYAGRLAEEKRVDVVLDAWREVERRARVRLAIVGAGPDAPRLRRHPYASRVYWLPFVSERQRLADLLASADLYVAPGPLETFGLSVLEAMASGLPVLSVDEGGGAELVQRAGAGECYRDGDAGHCSEAGVRLAQQNLATLGARARDYAERHHAWARVLDRFFATYRRLLAEHR